MSKTSQTTKTSPKSRRAAEAPRADIYERVTAAIVASLETGALPWLKPWSAASEERRPLLPLRGNGVPYRGVNVLLLWGAALDGGFVSNIWMTYKQAQERGGQVRKGEKGSMVVYADRYTKTETDEQGEDEARQIAFMKAYTVFNVDQIDGLPAETYTSPPPLDDGRRVELIDEAESFIAGTGATVRHGGNRAFYAPSSDHIQMPPPQAFRDAESYTAIKAHELVHWSGHPERCAREFGKRFGDRAYAFEELVAELGAAFLCADLALTPETRPDHAAYLSHWLDVLKADKRAIFTAASAAQTACDFLRGLQPVAV